MLRFQIDDNELESTIEFKYGFVGERFCEFSKMQTGTGRYIGLN